jgi:3D (Asp-Asp-Asp) domain-containing protein
MIVVRHWTVLWGGAAIAASLGISAPSVAATSSAKTAGSTTVMTATAYGPSAEDNYPYGATNFLGQPLTAGDIAVDASVIPLGSCIDVTGYHSPNLPGSGFIGEADDEGDAIQGDRIDIYLNGSAKKVSNFGIQSVNVTVLGPADTSTPSGTAACSTYQAAVMMHTTAVRKQSRHESQRPASTPARPYLAVSLNTIPSGIRRR